MNDWSSLLQAIAGVLVGLSLVINSVLKWKKEHKDQSKAPKAHSWWRSLTTQDKVFLFTVVWRLLMSIGGICMLLSMLNSSAPLDTSKMATIVIAGLLASLGLFDSPPQPRQ